MLGDFSDRNLRGESAFQRHRHAPLCDRSITRMKSASFASMPARDFSRSRKSRPAALSWSGPNPRDLDLSADGKTLYVANTARTHDGGDRRDQRRQPVGQESCRWAVLPPTSRSAANGALSAARKRTQRLNESGDRSRAAHTRRKRRGDKERRLHRSATRP